MSLPIARFIVVCLPVIAMLLSGTARARDIEQLEILKANYPRVFFFRASEQAQSVRRYPKYEDWEQQFNRLQGIMGKCLEEECLGREARNPEFFSRFKKDHPTQAVLLHFNGNSRDPRYRADKYFPGHWIYAKAVAITQDVPAESGETVITVQDARGFRVNVGRYKTSNDDIALFGIAPDGKHDWHHCEQVQLISVDTKANTITVKRGCYGTEPLAFLAGKSRAAAHVVEGPWGKTNNLLWYYNYSVHCPKDRGGKTCADHLVDDLAEWFGPTGPLAAFDGLEFDVLFNQTHGDTDGDGEQDNGVIDGVNQYGIGVVQFARQLRERMSDNFIIQGDGALGPGGVRSQRAWGILNGIESEGWPNLGDWEIEDWSGGLNRHIFWRDNAREPVFNYVNHKWNEAVPGKPGARAHPNVPFSRHRFAFAACQFFDAMICYSFAPRNAPGGKFGVWDEFRRGVDNQLGWLGRPEGPALRLAAQAPDQLGGRGKGSALATMISGPVKATNTAEGTRITNRNPEAERLRFTLRGIPADGPDLYVSVEMSGDTMDGYPREMARFAEVGVSGGVLDLMVGRPTEIGMKLRTANREVPLDKSQGASFQSHPREIAGVKLPTYFVHLPYTSGRGYTFWTQEIDVPKDGELRFSIGMGELSPQRSDGVRFEVHAAEVGNGKVGGYAKIFEHTTNQHQWLPQAVSLSSFGKKRIRLKFIADCGPKDNATTDHAHWGDVKIVKPGVVESRITEAKQYMTWVNDRMFRSGFYYRHIRSDEVDLSFAIEGKQSVTLRSVTAHAHPDAIYRVFEGGIVLANPSLKPYTFDLDQISPGRQYRRFKATPQQDLKTNNGRPVGKTVTLGERDALFLARMK